VLALINSLRSISIPLPSTIHRSPSRLPFVLLLHTMRLNNIECVVETVGPGLKLHEHGTAYGDGLVCCYIAAPERPIRFQIRIKSDAFIASGLAAFVHIDGKYQSNKFMPHLGSSKAYDKLDLVFRGKEVLNKTHTQTNFSRKAWTFDDLDTGSQVLLATKYKCLDN